MKPTRLAAALVTLGLTLFLGLGAFGQESGKPGTAPGRYVAWAPGVLDTASGAAYFVDPLSPDEVVTLDLPGCHASIRPVAKDASGWGAVELPKNDPAVVAARASVFVPLGGNVAGSFGGVVDTRTGAVYTLEAPEVKWPTKVADLKGVRVVRVDPVLGTRTIRDLTISRRGG